MALKVIYTFFIGILVVLFVGAGIQAFYPEPTYPYSSIRGSELSGVDYQREMEQYDLNRKTYNRNVTVITLTFAVAILILSLSLSHALMVISDGLLLGGVLTLLYSVIRVFGSGDDKLRFLVITIGLVISLSVGYFKFIRGSKSITAGV